MIGSPAGYAPRRVETREKINTVLRRTRLDSLRRVYVAALVIWLVTRVLVLIHQGAWPWMNAFVVESAEGFLSGDWSGAIRPPLPALLALPLVGAGANQLQAVAGLYLIASTIQFGAYLLVIRELWPARWREQVLALLLFLIIPLNHSIHHYRDVPVVLASSATFLLSAYWLRVLRGRSHVPSWVGVLWVAGATILGVWSRTEVLTFIGVLCLLGLLLLRRRAWRLVALYAVAACLGIGTLLVLDHLGGVDPTLASQYQVHTFLDSTPQSWLTPACQANPSENCRDADGSVIFGPVDRDAGVLGIVKAHPLLVLEKTVRSAVDNLWVLYGDNISTFPGAVLLLFGGLLTSARARRALRRLPAAVWCVAGATCAISTVPPLSWAPPHPQYHLHALLLVVILLVPVLAALWREWWGRRVDLAFVLGSIALSIFRYTRYPGY